MGQNRLSANDIYDDTTGLNTNPQLGQQTLAKPAGIFDTAKDVGKGVLPFLKSSGGGMVAVGLMQLAGGILSSMFAEEPRRQLSPQEIQFKKMTKFYARMGQQQSAMRSIVAGYRGNQPAENTDVGFGSTREMIQAVPYRDSERGRG